MKKHPFLVLIFLCLLGLMGGVLLNACAPVQASQSIVDVQAEINTAVAATLVQYAIETKVAEKSVGLEVEPVVQVAATATPLPTATSIPTATTVPAQAAPTTATTALQPTTAPAPASVVYPQIASEQNTNCRLGPGTRYLVDAVFLKGATSLVYGRDATRDWWYIQHPANPGSYCWVWDGSTMVIGDARNVPIVAAPTNSSTKTSNVYGNTWYPNNGNANNWCDYNGICYNNGYPYNYGYCGFVNGVLYPKCKPKEKIFCGTPVNWWNCNNIYVNNCSCKVNWKYTCKQSKCPPVTIVNVDTYCKKYPNCCK